ncbi:hypothetical protein TNCV_3396231 [Trichonephila clavipes]|nr:hypothetical protein TNCV_3396231 [Trichonephila clavipes]
MLPYTDAGTKRQEGSGLLRASTERKSSISDWANEDHCADCPSSLLASLLSLYAAHGFYFLLLVCELLQHFPGQCSFCSLQLIRTRITPHLPPGDYGISIGSWLTLSQVRA